MNRKGFLILLVLLVLLGGLGLMMFRQDLGAWRSSEFSVGSKLFDKVSINDIAKIHLVDAKGEVTLAIKDKRWVVEQRKDYHANHQQVSDLLLKVSGLKVVQTENVGATLLPRLNLVDQNDAKQVKEADNVGTRFELSDKGGKVVASLLLGKKVIKEEDSPLPIKPKKDVGRYVLIPGNATVLVTSDALSSAEARPERWISRDFFKVDRVKSFSSAGDGASWKIVRPEEFGPWKLADSSEPLNSSNATEAANALAKMSPDDVAPDLKPESLANPRTLVAETYDNLTYTIKLAKKADSEDYYLWFTVSGEPPSVRKPEKWEKGEDKERLDKQYAEDQKRLEERLKLEKSLSAWTFVVSSKTLDPVLKQRSQLVATKEPAEGKRKK